MTDKQPVSGSMLLYDKPELLSKEDHGRLGLRALGQPFAFAREVRAVPLVMTEFRSAQRHCPVVFTERDKPVPMAMLGLIEQRNLFVDDQGRWRVPGYIPAYLRCYPLALASATEDRYALVVDRAADMVTDQPDVPFFDGDQLTPHLQERLEFCRTYQADKQRTQAFCDTLQRLDLLVAQQATHTVDGEQQPLARYFVVDQDKLMTLDKDTLQTLFQDGSLAAIIAHLFSLDNVAELVRLRQAAAA